MAMEFLVYYYYFFSFPRSLSLVCMRAWLVKILTEAILSCPGGTTLRKQLLDDRKFPKMHLNLQHLLQVFIHLILLVVGRLTQRPWPVYMDRLNKELPALNGLLILSFS